jgi:hypothetical protein
MRITKQKQTTTGSMVTQDVRYHNSHSIELSVIQECGFVVDITAHYDKVLHQGEKKES